MFSDIDNEVKSAVIDRRLESAVTLCDASWIKPFAANSLLPCKRESPVGGILEQSPRG